MDLGATAAGRQRDVDAAAAFQAALGIRVDLVTVEGVELAWETIKVVTWVEG